LPNDANTAFFNGRNRIETGAGCPVGLKVVKMVLTARQYQPRHFSVLA
jgi:hypothetical protein